MKKIFIILMLTFPIINNLYSQGCEIEPNDSLANNYNPIIAANGGYHGHVEWDSIYGGDIDIWKIIPGSSGFLSIALYLPFDGSQVSGGLYESDKPYDLGKFLGVVDTFELYPHKYYFLLTAGHEPILEGASNSYGWSLSGNVIFPQAVVYHEYEPKITYSLYQNYPNPFNLETEIKYSLPKYSKAELKIYNVKGELVNTIVNENKEKGIYSVIWDGKDINYIQVSSGIYSYRLKANEKIITKRMLLLK
ncbi:T9SS type A sorting domain-containing protein [candidate division KSB1 bacterium]|nr:T9SS type A sorting domain-containing protein [candidate division KSB1 bacterium]